jgi:hypothetical protein
MKSIRRTFVLAPAVLAAVALTATSAMAASTVKVPFSFKVDGKDCPAGRYTIDRDSVDHIVTLRSTKSSQAFSWLVGPGDPDPTDTKVSLKFDQDGSTHTLRSVQVGAEITSNLDKGSKQNERSGQGQ